MIKNMVLTADTPLSDLFRRTFHEELRQVINAWRPFLINDDKTKDALELCRFDFDKKHLTAKRVYWDLSQTGLLGLGGFGRAWCLTTIIADAGRLPVFALQPEQNSIDTLSTVGACS